MMVVRTWDGGRTRRGGEDGSNGMWRGWRRRAEEREDRYMQVGPGFNDDGRSGWKPAWQWVESIITSTGSGSRLTAHGYHQISQRLEPANQPKSAAGIGARSWGDEITRLQNSKSLTLK